MEVTSRLKQFGLHNLTQSPAITKSKIRVVFDAWTIAASFIAAMVLLPIVVLIVLSIDSDLSIWQHLANTVLSDYLKTTFLLLIGVAFFSTILGVSSALIVSHFDFIGARFFTWALVLPLATPAYITAYAYTGLLDVAGPMQTHIRQVFDLQVGDYWFPQMRSLGGAIFVLSFVLYPYIYLLARSAFAEQSASLNNAAKTLGQSQFQSFLKVTIPIARPAIFAGLALVLMETLADYGAVSYFGLSTFTTGIFRTWYGLDSVNTAAQLAITLLCFVIVILFLEKSARRRAAFYSRANTNKANKIRLNDFYQGLAIFALSLPLLLGFIIPSGQLLIWALPQADQFIQASYFSLLRNTLLLASITSILAILFAMILVYSQRLNPSKLNLLAKSVAGLGYAVPGLIIAIGVLVPLGWFDNTLDAWLRASFGISSGLLLSGSIAALVIAYLVRFLALAINSVESGLAVVQPAMDQSARSLGLSSFATIRRVHLPLMRASVLSGMLIVFVDVMKELPATLVLRPFNFNTLAVRAYELASDERLADAALPSIAIVVAGLIPIIFLTRIMTSDN